MRFAKDFEDDIEEWASAHYNLYEWNRASMDRIDDLGIDYIGIDDIERENENLRKVIEDASKQWIRAHDKLNEINSELRDRIFEATQ